MYLSMKTLFLNKKKLLFVFSLFVIIISTFCFYKAYSDDYDREYYIDQDICIGCGDCVTKAPDLIRIIDGKPNWKPAEGRHIILFGSNIQGLINPNDIDKSDAIDAMDVCPAGAITDHYPN